MVEENRKIIFTVNSGNLYFFFDTHNLVKTTPETTDNTKTVQMSVYKMWKRRAAYASNNFKS